jgi:O-antigen ligase
MFQKIVTRFVTKANLLILISIQNVLGILTIFLSPIPIPPKTSIGLLTGTSILIVIFLIIFWKNKKIIKNNKTILLVDCLVIGFVFVNALSLVTSQYIYELTSFRLLLIAVVQYTAVRLIDFSEEEIHATFQVIGITTVIVGFISLFQLVFRDQAIILAKRFLFGDAAYSIAADLDRGRGPQWGLIIATFPLYIGSMLLAKKKYKFFSQMYMWAGVFLIPFSFVASNFRWLTFCFFLGLSFYIFVLFRYALITKKQLIKIISPIVISIVVGILIASSVFQYNLIDRFLLKVKSRDVTFTIGRLFLYQQALYAFTSSPIIGIGVGNYRYIIERPVILHYYNFVSGGEGGVDETARESVSSHSDLLTILAETGIAGMLVYISIAYVVIRKLVNWVKECAYHKDMRDVLVPLSALTAVALFFTYGIFENTAPNNTIYLFFIYGISISLHDEHKLTQSQKKEF